MASFEVDENSESAPVLRGCGTTGLLLVDIREDSTKDSTGSGVAVFEDAVTPVVGVCKAVIDGCDNVDDNSELSLDTGEGVIDDRRTKLDVCELVAETELELVDGSGTLVDDGEEAIDNSGLVTDGLVADGLGVVDDFEDMAED